MLKAIGRLLAFCSKEANEIARQPRLVLSLLLGPSLILMLFGVGYQSDRPNLETLLVLPANPPEGYPVEDIERVVKANFNVVGVVSDRQAALDRLERREVEVVEVWPDTLDQLMVGGQKLPVEFYANEINPLNEQWIQYLAYAQINEVNNALLTDIAARNQGEAADAEQFLSEARQQVQALRTGVTSVDQADRLERLERIAGLLAVSAAVTSPDVRQDLLQLQGDLRAVREAQQQGQLTTQSQRLQETEERIGRLEQVTGQLKAIPPDVLVSPLYQQYNSLAKIKLDAMTFYAPAVLALLIQHIAVALGALSLVREQQLGSMELFRVAPVTPLQLLLGKYLGYLIFIAALIAVLTLLIIYGLGVPFLGNVWWFVLESLMLVMAALGIGFTISAISKTDSQAVQFSMLVLLLSIFFGGFFLPLDSFSPEVRSISYALPLTHGIMSFQQEMLTGRLTNITPLLWLGVIAALTFATALFFTGRQFRRI